MAAWILCGLCIVATVVAAGPQNTKAAEEEIKPLIVMITSQFERGKIIGAGIIFGVENDRLYIATAAHLVRHEGQEVQEVQVQFRWLDKTVKASLLKQVGRPLDLAVLSVTGLKGLGINVNALPFDRLGNAASLKRGDSVYSLGNPHGKKWSINVMPDKVSQREGDLLYFLSNFIGEGHSGGALLNDRWELVGMILSDHPPDGEAISIARILAILRDWKYPVNLRSRFTETDLRPASAGVGGHTCGITTSGTAYCWGMNQNGELGNGSETDSAFPVPVYGGHTFVSVSTGLWYSCGVTTSGTAYCWGNNASGELGDGSQTNSNVPVPVSGALTFASVSAGHDHTCGVTTGGAVYCWGGNEYGQLGNGSKTNSNIPTRISVGLSFKSVSAGVLYTCGINTSDRAYCWGTSSKGRLGTGSDIDSLKPVPVSGNLTFISISAGDGQTCGTTAAGRTYCWGYNEYGQLGNGSKTDSSVPVLVSGSLAFKSVGAGGLYTCGITTAGTVYCWGWAVAGFADSDVPDLFFSDAKIIFATISTGSSHVCGTTTGGATYCWGSNKYGQLGDGSNGGRLNPVLIPLRP